MSSGYGRALVPLVALLVGAVGAVPSRRVEDRPLGGAEVYRKALAATAWVRAADVGQGTGWVVDRSRRWLVTCYHVVGDNDTVDVVFPVTERGAVRGERQFYIEKMPRLWESGRAVRGRVLRRDRQTDLALVELESLPAGVGELTLGDSPRPGERGHVVGNRYDTDVLWVHGGGAVRQVRTLRKGYFNAGRQLAKGTRVVVTQVPINEGDSGAALVDERGRVIGVAAAVEWEEKGAGLFIDVREVRALLGGRASRPPEDGGRDARPPNTPGAGRSVGRDVYRRGLRSLALVQTASDTRASGWLLDRGRRLLVTTCEGVGKDKTAEVFFPVHQGGQVIADGRFYREQKRLLRARGVLVVGTVLATDARRNLALVELASVPAGVAEIRFAEAAPLPGDSLHALGHLGRQSTLWVYTAASVRQRGHANLGQTADGPDPAVLLVQAPLNEGEGGGPLLNDRGELAGVVSGKVAPQQQVAYGLTLEEVRAFLDENRPHWGPQGAAELCRRGRLFTEARRYERALADFTEAIRLDPNCSRAYSERGRAYHLQGLDDRALADCDRAIRLDPKLATAYCHRAAVLCRKGEAAKAIGDCDTALRLDDKYAAAYSTRAHARLLRGDVEGALRDCDEAIWLDRRLPLAHVYRGMTHARKDQHDRAIEDFTQALRLDPLLAEAYRHRGDSHWARSDAVAALADYDQALTLDPRDARACFGRGRAWISRGESDKALADFAEAIRLDRRLTGDVVAMIEQRGAELTRGEREDWAGCYEFYRRTLVALRPLLKDPRARKAIDAGLTAAEREKDPRKRAKILGEALAAVRMQGHNDERRRAGKD